MDKVINYFNRDSMASDAWIGKYQMKDTNGVALEDTPKDMHYREAREFARIEYDRLQEELNISKEQIDNLSDFGKKLLAKRASQTKDDIVEELFSYFDRFGLIVPQGSIMANLGNKYVFGSLSNCFVIAPPSDSYGGICRADQELVQFMKRRGGVGTHLNNLRPALAKVSNASKSSTGAPSFAERFSNSTREVAQEGRRGALMLLLHVKHPDIFKWVTMKDDRTKVTGANVSVMFTDDFMVKVSNKEDFMCRFPIEDTDEIDMEQYSNLAYNELFEYVQGKYIMKIKAEELFNIFVHMAWANAEPGAAYIDRIIDYSPDGVYEAYIPQACNPCGEQWFHAYDTCRLITLNFFGIVTHPFTEESSIDFEKLYEISYIQQRLGDNLVDLEIESIERIRTKLLTEYEQGNNDDKLELLVEINQWRKVAKLAEEGRRTGSGFTALGDMLAAINTKYGSEQSMFVVDSVMYIKMKAELDASIDMAITRGAFTGWDKDKEFTYDYEGLEFQGKNAFFTMLAKEFPVQTERMFTFGRRNVNWSTVAPTGTVSLMTQTTSGLEPLFKAFYIRRKKINPNETGVRIDFTDQNGDNWQEYPILHPKFADWIKQYTVDNIGELSEGILKGYKLEMKDMDQDLLSELVAGLNKDDIQELFEKSPWFGAQAEDIPWEERIEMNSIIQKYTSNSLSCTINLPEDIEESVVTNIYMEAWKQGLKGVTVYREGSRSGVLISATTPIAKVDEFGYTDAIKRPEVLEADYHRLVSNGKNYAVIVGKLNDKPYEIFAYENPMALTVTGISGEIKKNGRGHYSFNSDLVTISRLELNSDHSDERLLTRMASMLLRHGASPKFVVDQVEKSEITFSSFGKAISRVLSKYVVVEEVHGEACPECNSKLIKQEGCTKCSECSYSKC